MCQLLGMNCNVPTDIVFSFTVLATLPLTDNEQWRTLAPRELVVFHQAQRV